ncbi:inactive non-canonical poly(A) RNA polymerase protein Trf4-2 [Drosophila novamexicana]|uniref:inactive non-canonical poly(A) RNA polymerase protein Trf4-2 n=1 Tax=Drosophila novamexicana TaxID=47314 RepID=UPI0011E595DA|nr:inactive non-canonical poly(A) RNA polymerase protein Trf4-2 [Drosophila novamexicana]
MSKVTDQREPWLMPNFEYGSGVAALHQEIEHFYNYIVSTPTEYMMRMEAVHRIERVVLSIWPEACIEVFGSFRTGLNLPISDIDIAVNNFYWHGAPLLELKNALMARGVADNVNVLDKASVPVVKFTERISEIKFDISFNTTTGVKAAELVQRFIEQFPELPKLVIILKQYLMLQGLNEVYSSGGISSYAVTLMCISFLQQQSLSETKTCKNDNKLGKLLLKFLDFYGRKFDYFKYGISVRGSGGSVEKCVLQSTFGDYNWLSVLTIEDPITPTNDIGRSSFGALDVKQGFEMAFLKLSKLVDLDSSKISGSILASIVKVPQSVINYRNWVHYKFRHLVTISTQPINGFERYFGYAVKLKFNATTLQDEQEENKEIVSNLNGMPLTHNGCQYKGLGC